MRAIVCMVGCVVALWAHAAGAHLMKAGHGTLNVVDQKAYIVLSVPVGAFAGTEAAAAVYDGVLTAAELAEHRAALRAAVRARVKVRAGEVPATFSTVIVNLPVGIGHTPGEGDELTVMIVAPLGAAPQTIGFESQLWARSDDALRIQTSLTVEGRVVRSEIGELSPSRPAYLFFAPTGHTLVTAARRGLVHLVGGPDHLVFLVLLVLGSMNRRSWATRAAVFTAACCAALGAAVAGLIAPPPDWVEVGIAASAVVLASIRLAAGALTPAVEHALCAGFALFHGLGFAAVGGFGYAPVVKLTGFGLGLSIGVLLVLVLLHGLCVALRRALGPRRLPAVAFGLAAIALCIGVLWTVERVPLPGGSPAGHGPAHRGGPTT